MSPADPAARAARNLARNAEAAGLSLALPDATWCVGRDASLTCRVGGTWAGGTSMPGVVGRAMCHEAGEATRALVAPNTMGHVLAALDAGSLSVVWPDARAAAVALACADVSDAITQGRLVCLVGADSVVAEARRRRGWALPTTLHLPHDSAAVQGRAKVEALLTQTREAFARATRERHAAVADALTRWTGGGTLVVAASGGDVLDDPGDALASAVTGRRFDPNDPRTASALALADATRDASTVVTAERFRHELAVPGGACVVTWVLRDITPVPPASQLDAVILADAAWAGAWHAAGWHASRLRVAGWPVRVDVTPAASGVVLAWRDVPALHAPTCACSTQIVDELAADPFVLNRAGGTAAYLASRWDAAGVPHADVRAWRDAFVTPAYARGVARTVRRCNARITLSDPQTTAGLNLLAARHAAVLDPTPDGLPALASFGLPVIDARRHSADSLVRALRNARGTTFNNDRLADAVASLAQHAAPRRAA